jgi:competence protein ComEA
MTFSIRGIVATLMLATTAPAFAALSGVIDLNKAGQAELEMVKGIGPQLSDRILAERAREHFESWDDFIARMKGLGPTHAARLSAAGLRIGGEAYTGASKAPAGPAK